MRSLHSVLLLLTTVTPFLACTYKAEPVDGKQACAVGPQVCPDGYVCSVGFCYHSGVQPGGSEGGSRGGLPVTGGAVSFGGGGGMGGTRIVGTGGIGTKPGTGGASFPSSSPRLDGGLGGSSGGAVGKADAGGGTSNTATFQHGAAVGPISGYGWIAMAPLDFVTDPTCGPSGAPITATAPCMSVINWNAPNALCVTGYIPALPVAPTPDDFASNWGIEIGVNAGVVPGVPIGKSYSTLAAFVSGVPTSTFRLGVHRAGDPSTVIYCFNYVTSWAAVALTQFNTACWDNSGTYFTAADAANIDLLNVQVLSASTAITLTNMCLNSITFGD